MKVTQRQPICITRLKKKSSIGSNPNSTDCTLNPEQRLSLSQIPNNICALEQSQAVYCPKQTPYRHCSKSSLISQYTTESNFYSLKENVVHQGYQTIAQDQTLLKKIKDLEISNELLKRRNQDLENKLNAQLTEKSVLNNRIDKLQKQICKLQSQFEQQYRLNQPLQKLSCKISQLESRIQSPSSLSSSMTLSRDSLGYRRLSFNEPSYQYKTEDQSSKLKEYKNKLQTQKIRSVNLQHQLTTCKENIKLQFKNQIQSLIHKVANLKETIARKDKQIGQKQDIIQRYVINRK